MGGVPPHELPPAACTLGHLRFSSAPCSLGAGEAAGARRVGGFAGGGSPAPTGFELELVHAGQRLVARVREVSDMDALVRMQEMVPPSPLVLSPPRAKLGS